MARLGELSPPRHRAALPAALCCLALGAVAGAPSPTPPRGYTTCQTFEWALNATAVRSLGASMVSLGLLAAGYDILWIDDGWEACDTFDSSSRRGCAVQAPREADGTIAVDQTKFPGGLVPVIEYLHSLGLRVGIYSAPHRGTCGNFTASLGHEAVDAAAFALWGIDAVKMDAGCQDDCSLLDGCLVASLTRMRAAMNATGRPMLLYVDDGNPVSGPKVINPHTRGWPASAMATTHIARTWPQFVAAWGPGLADMFKLGFDRRDNWQSLLENVHAQAGLGWVQRPGAVLHPDQLTLGQGGMSAGQYRAEFFLYAVLAAPMFLSCQPAALAADAALLAMVTNPEILAVVDDPDGTMGTQAPPVSWDGGGNLSWPGYRWAGQLWIKPLAIGDLVAVLVNLDPTMPHDMLVEFGDDAGAAYDGVASDAFPAYFSPARVRDLHARADLGVFNYSVTVSVPPLDARILRISSPAAPAAAALLAAAA